MSVSEDVRSTTPNIDCNLCLPEISFSLSNNVQVESVNDFNSTSHVIFIHDVAPYQNNQYLLDSDNQNTVDTFIKKNRYITHIQGVKMNGDNMYGCTLPEIKVS